MTIARRLALLSALALAGCVSTNDEPFSLDDGDAVAPAANGYVCVSYDVNGKRTVATRQARIVALRANKKTQYVFLDDKASPTGPFTLHRTKGNLTIVAVAHPDAPGEDLYVAEFADAGKEFKLYAEGDDFALRAQAIAREHGATIAHSQFSDDLSGPVDAQKTFMIEMASDLKGWKMSADCRAKP